jgi:hypothetical protein
MREKYIYNLFTGINCLACPNFMRDLILNLVISARKVGYIAQIGDKFCAEWQGGVGSSGMSSRESLT